MIIDTLVIAGFILAVGAAVAGLIACTIVASARAVRGEIE